MPGFNPDFNILAIKNFPTGVDNNQLEMLLNNANGKEKIVCQFFHNSADALTLCVYLGTKNHDTFLKLPKIHVLENSGKFPATRVNITGKNVYLGDQEIPNKVKPAGGGAIIDQFDILDKLKNKPGKEFITFSPRLAASADTSISFVVYDLGFASAKDFEKDDALFFAAITPIDISLNPSPPRNGGGM